MHTPQPGANSYIQLGLYGYGLKGSASVAPLSVVPALVDKMKHKDVRHKISDKQDFYSHLRFKGSHVHFQCWYVTITLLRGKRLGQILLFLIQ